MKILLMYSVDRGLKIIEQYEQQTEKKNCWVFKNEMGTGGNLSKDVIQEVWWIWSKFKEADHFDIFNTIGLKTKYCNKISLLYNGDSCAEMEV